MGKIMAEFKEYRLPIKIVEQMIVNGGEHIIYNNGKIEKIFEDESNSRINNYYFKGFNSTECSQSKFVDEFCGFRVENLSKCLNSQTLAIYFFVDLESSGEIIWKFTRKK